MEKIVIRSKFVYGISSNYNLQIGKEYNSLQDLKKDYSMDYLMKVLYEEEEKKYEELEDEFFKCVNNEKSYVTENFINCYKISEQYAVKIDEHIIIYHLEEPIVLENKNLVPWWYASGELYIGDAWWFDQDEIVRDLSKLSILEFFGKYKGF
jgi:hypothetical protein